MTKRQLIHPDAGAAPRQSLPAEVHALAPLPAFLPDAPIVIGAYVVVTDELGVVNSTPTAVRMTQTTIYDDVPWAWLDTGEWRPFRDLRVVAVPSEVPS